jgi:hypothetical protein
LAYEDRKFRGGAAKFILNPTSAGPGFGLEVIVMETRGKRKTEMVRTRRTIIKRSAKTGKEE